MAMIDDETLAEKDGDVLAALGARRKEAFSYLQEHGSLPPWFEFGVSLARQPGRQRKFENTDAFLGKAMEYFTMCAENGIIPMPGGLWVYMGFTSAASVLNFVKRNPEFRPAHQAVLTWLKIPLEWLLTEPGQNTSGAWKRLTNIPDGWEVDEDTNVVPLRYEYKDRRQQEIVGLDGTTLDVMPAGKTAEELYREMQKAGRKLVEADDVAPAS